MVFGSCRYIRIPPVEAVDVGVEEKGNKEENMKRNTIALKSSYVLKSVASSTIAELNFLLFLFLFLHFEEECWQ